MAKAAAAAPSEGAPGAVLPPPPPSGRAEWEAQKRRDRRQARYDEIRALSREGHGVRAMARHLHLSRTTVVKYLRADSCPHLAPRPNRRNLVDLWLPHLRQRCAAGCRNAQELYRELKALGFPVDKSIVSARLAQ